MLDRKIDFFIKSGSDTFVSVSQPIAVLTEQKTENPLCLGCDAQFGFLQKRVNCKRCGFGVCFQCIDKQKYCPVCSLLIDQNTCSFGPDELVGVQNEKLMKLMQLPEPIIQTQCIQYFANQLKSNQARQQMKNEDLIYQTAIQLLLSGVQCIKTKDYEKYQSKTIFELCIAQPLNFFINFTAGTDQLQDQILSFQTVEALLKILESDTKQLIKELCVWLLRNLSATSKGAQLILQFNLTKMIFNQLNIQVTDNLVGLAANLCKVSSQFATQIIPLENIINVAKKFDFINIVLQNKDNKVQFQFVRFLIYTNQFFLEQTPNLVVQTLLTEDFDGQNQKYLLGVVIWALIQLLEVNNIDFQNLLLKQLFESPTCINKIIKAMNICKQAFVLFQKLMTQECFKLIHEHMYLKQLLIEIIKINENEKEISQYILEIQKWIQ